MKIAIAGDGAGVELAKRPVPELSTTHEVVGGFAHRLRRRPLLRQSRERVAMGVLDGTWDRAVLICGTGIGVSIAAKKVPGIRAAVCHDTYLAERAAHSNNAQIITMGARVIGPELAKSTSCGSSPAPLGEHGASRDNVEAINAIDKKCHAI